MNSFVLFVLRVYLDLLSLLYPVLFTIKTSQKALGNKLGIGHLQSTYYSTYNWQCVGLNPIPKALLVEQLEEVAEDGLKESL